MNINLLDDRVLVEPIERKFTKGGLILPPGAGDKQPFVMKDGIVIKVGPGKVSATGERVKMTLAEGDLVYYPANLAGPVEIDGKAYVILNENGVIAFTKKKDIEED